MRVFALAAALLLAACSRDAPPPAPPPAPPATAPATTPEARPARRSSAEPDWGEPDMPKLQKLFLARRAAIRTCYESALQREATTSGRFTLRFTIVPGGAVEDVSFEKSTFRRRDVPRCVTDVVRGWRTPFRPAEPVSVEYPLRFTPF